jgi:hypothetical protein
MCDYNIVCLGENDLFKLFIIIIIIIIIIILGGGGC